MNLYYLKKQLQYRWLAKNRHGIHSPFVFQFIEQVLRNRSKPFLQRVEQYFRGSQLVFAEPAQLHQDIIAIEGDTVVVVGDIYKSEDNYKAWIQYARQDAIPLSMEACGYGILCFKKDFVVKQHFIVK